MDIISTHGQWITIPHHKSWVCLHSSTKKGIRMDVSKSESVFFGFFDSSLQLWRIENHATPYWDNCFCKQTPDFWGLTVNLCLWVKLKCSHYKTFFKMLRYLPLLAWKWPMKCSMKCKVSCCLDRQERLGRWAAGSRFHFGNHFE